MSLYLFFYIVKYIKKLWYTTIKLSPFVLNINNFISLKYPRKLITHLNEKGLNVKEKSTGIYYVENVDIPTQILVQSQLPDAENEYLALLTNQNISIEYKKKCLGELIWG